MRHIAAQNKHWYTSSAKMCEHEEDPNFEISLGFIVWYDYATNVGVPVCFIVWYMLHLPVNYVGTPVEPHYGGNLVKWPVQRAVLILKLY